MSSKDSHPIRNGIIVTVGGSIITAFLPPVRSFLGAATTKLWNFFEATWKVFTQWHALPGWLIFLLSLLSAIFLLGMVRSFMARRKPDFCRYTQDDYRGARWRWEWAGKEIRNLQGFCPKCDCELVYDDSSCRRFHADPQTVFFCEACGDEVASILGGKYEYAMEAVRRELRRRIRTKQISTDSISGPYSDDRKASQL